MKPRFLVSMTIFLWPYNILLIQNGNMSIMPEKMPRILRFKGGFDDNNLQYDKAMDELNTDLCCLFDFIHMTFEAVMAINVCAEAV
jgi:hypothetical protein